MQIRKSESSLLPLIAGLPGLPGSKVIRFHLASKHAFGVRFVAGSRPPQAGSVVMASHCQAISFRAPSNVCIETVLDALQVCLGVGNVL